MALLSGKTGFVTDSTGTTRSFGKWSLAIKVGKPKVTNWNTSPYQALVSGIYSGNLSLSGPYDYGNMPFTAGGPQVFNLGLFNGVYLTGAFIIDIDIDNDVDGNPSVKITGESSGAFSISIA